MCLAAIYWARIGKVFFAAQREDAANVGFDDEFIYKELNAPITERRVTCRQVLRNEALDAMREWAASPDKVRY